MVAVIAVFGVAWMADTVFAANLETVKSLRPGIPVYGSIIEASECLTRLVGQANAMLWMGEDPDRIGRVVNRLGA